MSSVEIYGLFDPDTDELRYVGKANSAARRFKTHIAERVLSRPVNRWIAALIKEGKTPVMRVLETVPDGQWEEAEKRLIALHRKTCKLLNLADGGAMPSQTKEQRQKAARASNEAQAKKLPEWKALQAAKKDMGRLHAKYMKQGDFSGAYKLKFIMRCHAANRPEWYGSWANL